MVLYLYWHLLPEPEFPSVNVYRDKFTEIGKNGFLEISREKREKLLAVGFEFFSIEITLD